MSCAWLRRLAAERLPKHMVPARVVAIDAMPLTTSGKVGEMGREMGEDHWSAYNHSTLFSNYKDLGSCRETH